MSPLHRAAGVALSNCIQLGVPLAGKRKQASTVAAVASTIGAKPVRSGTDSFFTLRPQGLPRPKPAFERNVASGLSFDSLARDNTSLVCGGGSCR